MFRVVAEPPGGVLLSAWLDDGAPTPLGYLAGGFAGVDRARVADGQMGRLVEYRTGSFRTVCRSDEVLWWVTATRDRSGERAVFAAGEHGRVVRLHADGSCEALSVGGAAARPTLWGALAIAADDVWFVGGSATPGGPTGVLVHFDGTRFTQDPTVPEAALRQSFYKIARDGEGALYVVGTGATLLRRAAGASTWVSLSVDARPTDNRLFTVACAREGSRCYAVGGAGGGLLLAGSRDVWRSVERLGATDVQDLPGLNGVWVDAAGTAFVVGNNGLTLFTDGVDAYRPTAALTGNTLHGVAGARGVLLAVGGELGTWTEAQRAAVLARGDPSSRFDFDGTVFTPRGSERATLRPAPDATGASSR